jgi:hypothetical protein
MLLLQHKKKRKTRNPGIGLAQGETGLKVSLGWARRNASVVLSNEDNSLVVPTLKIGGAKRELDCPDSRPYAQRA